MYLKRLEIQGFKSLADKIELQFNPGVTGVVGPNGSGKSNISDAIRWVLGEQSAKSLRGAKMEDIIFSGSASRRPVGMAEVSLTLDNSSGRFPLDYSEVTVIRRVFRSGESEYMINMSPCRLRDIHELFMDTGIGREGYSIIGQGKIDEILNAKSEDRRQLIEEAAGIVKYKNRKIQAAKKLADTEQNLLRISDIIGELSAQAGPLEEQAATAEEYLNHKDELNKLEINLFVHQLEEVGDKLTEINTDLDEKKQAAVTVETDLRVAEAKAEELKLKVSKLNEEIAGVQQAVFDLASAVEKNEAAVKVAEERKRSLGRDRDRLESELTDIQRRIASVKDQYTGEEEALAKLRQDVSAVRKELAVQETGLAEVDARLTEGEAAIETGKGDIFEILHETASVRNELSNLDVKEKHHEKRIFQLNSDRTGAEAQAADTDRALEAAAREYQALTEGIREAEADLKQLVKQQAAAENRLTSLRDEISGRQKHIGEKESRLRVLEEMQQAYEGFHKGVREVLKAGKNGKLRGICGVVAELLQVPEEYALAVEVAIGGAVQFIVTETDRDAQEAIEFLKTGKTGRATFLPLNTIKGNNPDKPLEQVIQAKGCLGIAADLVKTGDRYNHILQFLLGRIAVFNNLEQARQAAKATGYRYKFVTLEGEIINAGGSFTGGSLARGNTGLLGRTGEIEGLKKDINRLQKELAKLSAAETGLQGEITGITDSISKNRVQTQEKSLKMTGAAKDLEQRKSDQERITRLTFSINMEIDQENNELIRIGKKKEELKVQLARMVKKNEDLQQNIGRMQDDLKGHQEKREQINALITASRVRLASLEQEAAGYEQLLARAHNSVEEFKQQVINKREELSGVNDTESKIDEEISALREQSVKQLEEKGAAGDRLNQLKAERNSDAAALDECDSSCRQMQKQLTSLQEQIHSIDIRRARLEMEEDNTRQRLMEEHGLTFEEALLKKTQVNNRREVTTRIKELKGLIAGLGTVNLGAIEEYNRVKERFEFLSAQHNDLEEARISLYKVIEEMDGLMTSRFKTAYEIINANFSETFKNLFGGGNAELQLTNSDNLLETGIEIVAQPPGKKPQHLSLLSGGERALTAIALLFAILKAKPSPFCVLDEIEAALDEANVDRFAGFLKEFSGETQFIVVTHRKGTMEVADVLYGVTMDETGVTKLVSMRLADTVDKVS